MKKILWIVCLILWCANSYATNWYFASNGNDITGTGTIGLPWQTISKFNSVFASKAAGDFFLFRGGDTFFGTLMITRSGSSGLPITIGSYGTGKAIVTGFNTVSSFTNVGGSVWESNVISSRTFCNSVSINGVNTPMGRFPNANVGYAVYQSASTTSMVSSSLNSSTTNWTGAELVIKKQRYVINRDLITAHSGTTLTYANDAYVGQANWGFFIQNDVRTLDVQNEWYYNPSTKRIRIFSASTPVNVQVAAKDTLAYVVFRNFITFDNLSFVGSNTSGIFIGSCQNMTVQNCNFDFCEDAIRGINFGGSSTNFIFNNNTVNHSNENGLSLPPEFSNATITNNLVKNSGLFEGMSASGEGKNQGMNIGGASSSNNLIEFNEVDSSGYIGIGFDGNQITVRHNFVNYYCITKDDGGGIYGGNVRTNNVISFNTVLNGIGNIDGVNTAGLTNPYRCMGIYIDNFSGGFFILNNTVAHSRYSGIFMHTTTNSTVSNNTVYDCDDNGIYWSNNGGNVISNIIQKSNICFARTASQLSFRIGTTSSQNNIPAWSTAANFDSNYYARPIDDNLTIMRTVTSDILQNIAMWRTFSGYDAHANKAPVTITNVNQLDFEYNATASPVVKTIPPGIWKDVRNVSYTSSVTLQPYTSIVLMNTGATNASPTVNAGIDQTIQLPTSTINLSGSASDPDGTVASVLWTRVSGSGTITTPTSLNTTVTGLTAGVSQFKLTATDNLGATGSDIMQVTVNPANVSPTANAGTDQAITLPTSTTTLVGSGNDPDGSITAYLWTKVSGPAGGNITSPTSATTGITALQAGTYVFNLRVTDNQGAQGNDQMTVIVNPAANVAPTANAGVDQTIQLPTSSVNLVGSGNDPDGSIASYLWTKVSGTGSTITSPTTASTSVTGLTAGVYQFKLTVTDNGGLTGSDIVVITVNPANIAPTANAGTDQAITLPTSSTTLSGSGNDPDGSITAYAWTRTSGPNTPTIVSPSSASTSVTGLIAGTYVFRLTVTDNQAATGFDEMTVIVSASANVAPTANAGIDQTIQLPTSSVNLVGSGNDPDGSIASYLWTKVSGGAATITSPATASTSVTGLTAGVYQFKLTVTDNGGLTGSDNMIVTVNPANVPPIANAGTDQSITLPTSSITFAGSASDPDGSVSSHVWTRTSGPNTPTITTPTSYTSTVTGLIAGTYVFRLTATDNQSLTGFDEMTVIVNPAANVAPTANAGIDQTIQLPTSSANLVGSGNDPDGTISSYAWTQVSGAAATITTPSSASTSVTGMTTSGTYQFKLTVTDNGGLTGSDNMIVTVTPANVAPVVNAGTDQSITSPTSTVTLSGSASDPDGSISSHTWTKISGPAGGTITSPANFSTTVTGLTVGTYVFRLTATDNQSLTGFDEMTVLVNSAINVNPVANAGSDQVITYPTTSVSVAGSGTDADGTIVAYLWTKISGGSATITNPTSASTTITGLSIGVYQFQLKVTDNSGGTGTDVMQVTLNQGTATVSYTVLSKVYNGAPQSPTIVTNPAGLATSTTYNGLGSQPTNAGSYSVVTNITDPNYTSSPISGTFVITKATATINISNLNQIYNGSPKPITASTTPIGLTVLTILYNGSGTAPTNAGSYPIVVSLNNQNYQATNATGTLIIAKATPVVTWANPSAITYPTALSGTQLNASASVAGSFTYTPASGAVLNAGTQTLSVDFTPTDAANYNSVVNTTVTIVVNKGTATISLSNLAQVYDGTGKSAIATTNPVGLNVVSITYNGSATLPINAGTYAVVASLVNSNYNATNATGNLVISKATAVISIGNLNQTYNGSPKSVTTSTVPAGLTVISVTYNGSSTPPTNAGSYPIIASLSNANYQATNASATLVINAADPGISWSTPSAITYPTPLSATQLNASADAAGSFVYTPPAGTILNAGNHNLIADFTPTDGVNYNPVNGTTVTLLVNKATATITISNLNQNFDGNPKPVTVTTSPSGLGVLTILYNGSATAPSAIGSYTVNVTLSNTNYTASPASGTLVISSSSAAVTITNLSQTYTGSPLPVTVTTNPSGLPCDVSYNGSATVPTNAATYTVIATINDGGVHTGSATETYIINKANPVITWANPSAITYGTALGGTQLNASASTGGVFTYTPPSGTILNAGTQTLSTSFAPTDNSNYNTVPVTTVTIVVNKAVATLSLSNLNQAYDGNPKSATVTSSPVGLTVISVTYDGSSTPPSAVGSYAVNATLNNSNYTATPATGTLVISTVASGISISNLNQVYTGSPLPVTVITNPLGLTHTDTYNGGGVPTNVGSYTVIATLNDGTHTGADTQTLVISKATPVIVWPNPANISYGTALSGTQLNASTSVAGTFAYTPVSGSVLNVGTQNLVSTFTPTDASNYNSVVTIVPITVIKATATLTVSGLTQTYNGNPHPVIATSAPSGLSGITILYNGSPTPPTNAGSYPISITLVNDNYQATPISTTLVVAKAIPILSWVTPAQIQFGTALSSVQLNASANIPGSFSYNPANGSILSAGTHILSATFTPSDATNYATSIITVPINIYGTPFLLYWIDHGATFFDNLPGQIFPN